MDFERARRERGLTPTEAAREAGVPRSTLRDWIARTRGGSLTPGQRAFFETPDGLALLRTLLVATIFVMNLCGGLGVAMVRAFFRHAGLDELSACSETSLRRSRSAMITAISAWGDAQDRELAQTMPTRDILACVDENFHAAMMLVAMEPVSGMLLVERDATHRDGATWAEALREVKAVWPVRLLALVGDEARGLIRCAQKHLGVLKASELSQDRVEDARNVLSVGDEIEVKIISVDRKNRAISLSVKAKDVEDDRAAVRELRRQESDRPSPTTLGDLIKAQMEQNND